MPPKGVPAGVVRAVTTYTACVSPFERNLPMRPWHLAPLVALVLASPLSAQEGIDRFWAEVVRTVEEGDYEGLAATYREEGVLVSESSNSAVPIVEALARWRSGLEETREGRTTVTLGFRFTQRIHGESVAHDTGIFRHAARQGDGEPLTRYVHFQGLLAREAEGWKMIMEYQLGPATEEDWNALGG